MIIWLRKPLVLIFVLSDARTADDDACEGSPSEELGTEEKSCLLAKSFNRQSVYMSALDAVGGEPPKDKPRSAEAAAAIEDESLRVPAKLHLVNQLPFFR